MQDLTEDKIRDQIRAKHLPPWSNVTNKFSEFASNIFRDVSNAFLGNYTGVNDHLKNFQDGQLALRGRQDLLDNLLNYGSAYSDKAYVDMVANRWHRMPFNRQISTEMRGCEIIPEGGIRLLRKGLWDIRGHVFAGPCSGFLDREVTMEVRVYSPSGSLFSTLQGRVAGKSALSIPVIASVQVPDANYQVQVWIYSKNYYIRWGHGLSLIHI